MTLAILSVTPIIALSSYVVSEKNEEIEKLDAERLAFKESYKALSVEHKLTEEDLVMTDGELKIALDKNKSIETNYLKLEKTYDNLVIDYNEQSQKVKKLEEEIRSKKSKATSVIPSKYASWTKMSVVSTAYTSYENGDELSGRKWGNLTKSGEPAQYGYIAVDPSVIPLGTEVYIPSLNGVFKAMDTGNAIIGKKIDVYFNSLHEANQWGYKSNLEVYVNY